MADGLRQAPFWSTFEEATTQQCQPNYQGLPLHIKARIWTLFHKSHSRSINLIIFPSRQSSITPIGTCSIWSTIMRNVRKLRLETAECNVIHERLMMTELFTQFPEAEMAAVSELPVSIPSLPISHAYALSTQNLAEYETSFVQEQMQKWYDHRHGRIEDVAFDYQESKLNRSLGTPSFCRAN